MLTSKNKRVLAAIFARPVRANIRWSDVETLLGALGAKLTEGNGSRVRVELNGRRMVFHAPHPHPTIVKDAVRSLQRYLSEVGIEP